MVNDYYLTYFYIEENECFPFRYPKIKNKTVGPYGQEECQEILKKLKLTKNIKSVTIGEDFKIRKILEQK